MSRKLEKHNQPISIGIRLDNQLNYTEDNDEADNLNENQQIDNDNYDHYEHDDVNCIYDSPSVKSRNDYAGFKAN